MLLVPNLSAGTDFVAVGDVCHLIDNENVVSGAVLSSQEPLYLSATLPESNVYVFNIYDTAQSTSISLKVP